MFSLVAWLMARALSMLEETHLRGSCGRRLRALMDVEQPSCAWWAQLRERLTSRSRCVRIHLARYSEPHDYDLFILPAYSITFLHQRYTRATAAKDASTLHPYVNYCSNESACGWRGTAFGIPLPYDRAPILEPEVLRRRQLTGVALGTPRVS
jgi:hypothetical protein